MKVWRSIKNKRGYYTVEAAIVVPIVIIAVFTIATFGRVYGIYEKVVFAGVDSARAAMINSYVLGNDVTLYQRLRSHLKNESIVENYRIHSFRSGYDAKKYNNLISFRIKYGINIKSPLIDIGKNAREEDFVCRKFIGKLDEQNEFTFDRMEIDEEGKIVYLFPLDGEKYHSENCSYVVPAFFERILDRSLETEYDPCSQCDAKSLLQGSTVYVFAAYGDFYHKKDCMTVRKNVIKATLSTAIDRGYTPCSKCGGGQ